MSGTTVTPGTFPDLSVPGNLWQATSFFGWSPAIAKLGTQKYSLQVQAPEYQNNRGSKRDRLDCREKIPKDAPKQKEPHSRHYDGGEAWPLRFGWGLCILHVFNSFY